MQLHGPLVGAVAASGFGGSGLREAIAAAEPSTSSWLG